MTVVSFGCQDRTVREKGPRRTCTARGCTVTFSDLVFPTGSAQCSVHPGDILLTLNPCWLLVCLSGPNIKQIRFLLRKISIVNFVLQIEIVHNIWSCVQARKNVVFTLKVGSLSLQRIFIKLDLNLNIIFVLFHSSVTQTKLVFHFCVSFANLNDTIKIERKH